MAEGIPTHTTWPTSLTDPAKLSTVDEFGTVVRAVHEAAHAVVAAELGQMVTQIWVGDDAERDPAHPATATGTHLAHQSGDDGVIVALAAWPANLHQLRLLELDNQVNITGFGAAVVHDNTLAWRLHVADHPDCPDIPHQTVIDCDHIAHLVDTAVMMAHQCWSQILDLAHRLAAANGRLDHPDIPPNPPPLPIIDRGDIQPLGPSGLLRWTTTCICEPETR